MRTLKKMQRRDFFRNTALGLAASGLGLGTNLKGRKTLAPPNFQNLPRWKGFNFLDFFSPFPSRARPGTPEIFFQWMSDWGFDFVRVPMAYPVYLDIDYEKRITPEDVYRIDEGKAGRVDTLVEKAHKFGLHVSLNLHRGPGYCINAGFREPFHLWTDAEAQDAFACTDN